MATRHKFGTPVKFEGLEQPVIPYDVFGFFEDWHETGTLAASDTAVGGWTATHEGTGGTDTEVGLLAEIGGGLIIKVKGTSADNDGINLVKNGAIFEADDDTDIVFEAKLRIDGCDSSPSCNWALGLIAAGQTVLLANDAGITNVRNACFICSADGFAQIDANSTKGAVTDTRDTAVGLMVDDTFMTFRIVISGRSKIEFFINGARVSSSTVDAAIPDGTLTPIFAVKTADAATTKPEMEIKYCFCYQTYKQAT